MNAKFAAAFVFAAAVAAPVFAAESVDYGDLSPKAGTVTRAEVRAEVLRARAAGQLDITEADFPFIVAAAPATSLARADVRAAVLRARAAGELDVTEVNYPVQLASAPSTLTRAEVRAEVIRARKAGQLEFTEAGVAIAGR